MFRIMESSVLVKAFAMLEVLADAEDALGLGETSLRARVSKPTGRRVLQCLMSLGYVTQDGEGRYRLTGKLRQMGLGTADRLLVAMAEPSLRRLHSALDETVNLGVLRQGRVLYLSVLESGHALRRVVAVQESDPFFSTALGRAIVAYENAAVRDFLFRQIPLERRTPSTIVDPAKLKLLLDNAKRLGYAIEQDQNDTGVTCIAAPVMLRSLVIAAISVSIPTVRFTEIDSDRIISGVVKAAVTVGKAITKHKGALA
jgi:DNA-binding IclR family transcriptional regulator